MPVLHIFGNSNPRAVVPKLDLLFEGAAGHIFHCHLWTVDNRQPGASGQPLPYLCKPPLKTVTKGRIFVSLDIVAGPVLAAGRVGQDWVGLLGH